ncbi:MAG TPA: magnesium-translocating P-type ATPase [Candidatus Limnocylindrales bacterium]
MTVAASPSPGASDAVWTLDPDAALAELGSRSTGLSAAEAAARLARYGPNTIERRKRSDTLTLLVRQFASPIILILVVATIISGLLGDVTDTVIILAIIGLSGLLGFWQERGAARSVEALLAVVEVKADVIRAGATASVSLEGVVPGDVAVLNAGDLIPGDCLVLESTSLLVDEAVLTGETYPVEKKSGQIAASAPVSDRTNALFLGTHIVSGSGRALVVATGLQTQFGRVSARLAQRPSPTGFERGMTQFGFLLVRVMIVLVAVIFVANIVLARNFLDSALFALALAVGLTPQLLPAIVTISLSQGARLMARKRVIVKRLEAIEDFGAMSVLCTDKTGTMTVGTVELQAALGVDGAPSDAVKRMAYQNAKLQTGFANPIDQAIVQAVPASEAGSATRIAELPYDFSRTRLSVLVQDGATIQIITKGALDSVLGVCTQAQLPSGETVPIDSQRAQIQAAFTSLSAQGFRVLGVASRQMPGATSLAPNDESNLCFDGLLTFLDPPKLSARQTIADLGASGISVRMITGDNHLVAAHVAQLVGLDGSVVLSGEQIGALDDATLAAQAATTQVFAEIDPVAKERIIRALRATGKVVGYMGDGINDAPALHAADVGISVDSAVDVAKQAAAIVLLDKDLGVLLDGVRQGRRTFANTMKYVFTTTSASFGNVLSMAIASLALPFLPLTAGQILLINFLTDFPATTIATDEVDPEQLERPHDWNIGFVRTFMIVFGSLSSVFDLITFVVLPHATAADATAFRSGWFIESVATELAVLFVLRTRRPFFRSRPSMLLVGASVLLGLVAVAIPYSPLAIPLGLAGPSMALLGSLALITVAYVIANEIAKVPFYRRLAGTF